MSDDLCACGKPLHYSDPRKRELVEDMICTRGPTVPVIVNGRTWLVQRHYIALHGITASELPFLGFEEVKNG